MQRQHRLSRVARATSCTPRCLCKQSATLFLRQWQVLDVAANGVRQSYAAAFLAVLEVPIQYNSFHA